MGTWCSCIECIGEQPEPTEEEMAQISINEEIKAELIWCRDNGNTGPRTHALLVELCNRLAMPN